MLTYVATNPPWAVAFTAECRYRHADKQQSKSWKQYYKSSYPYYWKLEFKTRENKGFPRKEKNFMPLSISKLHKQHNAVTT